MNSYRNAAIIAIVIAAGICCVGLLMLLIRQHRRIGGLSLSRTMAFGLLAIYAAALMAYPMLPFPQNYGVTWCERYQVRVQLEPLRVVELVHRFADISWQAALGSFALWQFLLNVAFFVPLGLFAHRLLNVPKSITLALGLACSVLIEVVQGTAVFGLLPCRWRITDVDDVIANTLGTAVGIGLGALLLAGVSSVRAIDRRAGPPRPVTRSRRLSAIAIDTGLFALLVIIVALGLRGFDLITDRPANLPGSFTAVIRWLIPAGLICLLPRMSTLGATFGERITGFLPRWTRYPQGSGSLAGSFSFGRRLILGISGGAVIAVVLALAEASGQWLPVVAAVIWLLILAAVFVSDVRGLPGLASGARYVDRRDRGDPTDADPQTGSRTGAEKAGPPDQISFKP